MKTNIALAVVVLPAAVSPQTKRLRPYCRQSQRYAAIPASMVPQLISCVILIGVSLNFLTVILGPLMLTSLLCMMFTLLPSGITPSAIGCPSLTGLPIFSANSCEKVSAHSLSI